MNTTDDATIHINAETYRKLCEHWGVSRTENISEDAEGTVHLQPDGQASFTPDAGPDYDGSWTYDDTGPDMEQLREEIEEVRE